MQQHNICLIIIVIIIIIILVYLLCYNNKERFDSVTAKKILHNTHPTKAKALLKNTNIKRSKIVSSINNMTPDKVKNMIDNLDPSVKQYFKTKYNNIYNKGKQLLLEYLLIPTCPNCNRFHDSCVCVDPYSGSYSGTCGKPCP